MENTGEENTGKKNIYNDDAHDNAHNDNAHKENVHNEDRYARLKLLIGETAFEKLRGSRVAIFGVGGVGGYVCEALARSGIGTLDIIDSDTVAFSNLNRQIIATEDTVGRYKVDVMKERIHSIDPDTTVNIYRCFFLPENAADFPFDEYDYVVDAVDTVTAKIELILRCRDLGVPIISAMGAGNKLDPGRLKVADIYKTQICPLARVMRRELKKRGVKKLKVVYSDEEPVKPIMVGGAENAEAAAETADATEAEKVQTDGGKDPAGGEKDPSDKNLQRDGSARRSTPGSTAFVPATAGLLIAAEVVKDLMV